MANSPAGIKTGAAAAASLTPAPSASFRGAQAAAADRLLAAVDQEGIADRTIFVFFSDNGGWACPPKATDPKGFEKIPATTSLPLRSGKASLYIR